MFKLIYKPAGRAQEYAESSPGANDGYALNLFDGCTYACKYCFVPTVAPWRYRADPRETFHQTSMLRDNVLSRLKADVDSSPGFANPVHLCFTCDPYPPPIPAKTIPGMFVNMAPVTECALRIMAAGGFKNIQILTKAGEAPRRDFEILARNGWKFGTTLVFADEQKRLTWEPSSAPIDVRLKNLEIAASMGIQTWVSIEPVLYVSEAVAIIRTLLQPQYGNPFFKIGKLNHGKGISLELARIEAETNWAGFAREVSSLLNGRNFMLKQSLRDYL